MWQTIHETWKLQNKIINDNSNPPKWIRENTETNIKALYSQKNLVANIEQYIFDTPIDQILRLPLHQLEAKAERLHKCVAAAIARTKTRQTQSMQAINKFFQPSTTVTQIITNGTQKSQQGP